MLQSLHVHNFALLEDAKADFTSGFNVFTGETGAGKSILIDAFGVVLGGRAAADYVRTGTEGLWVQAIFDISQLPLVKEILKEQGIDAEDDLFLKRQISAAGKSKAFVNGVQVPLSFLRQLGNSLVNIHGQHENQALLKAETPRVLTDAFGGESLVKAKTAYSEIYTEYVTVKKKLEKLLSDNEQQDLLLDRYGWEIKEITDAKLVAGEEEDLEAEAKLLRNSEKIITSVNRAHSFLDSEKGILAQLALAKDELRYASRYDERLGEFTEALASSWITLDDCCTELSDYLSSSDFNEERADVVQGRLDTIYRLQKKYGGTTEDVLKYLAATIVKQQELQNIADTIAEIESQLKVIMEKLAQTAAALTKERKHSSKILAEQITAHIRDLAMPNGQFVIEIIPIEKFTAEGRDELRFMFSANMGEALNDLERVASGGEISRIALAIKTVLMNEGDVPTMVFDEIDTGVGGITAQRMAEKIAAISTVGQILCITHLPQIAAFADNHIHIEKVSAEGRTATVLNVLDDEARIEEIVRMIAGDNQSQAAYVNAKELLNSADAVKSSL